MTFEAFCGRFHRHASDNPNQCVAKGIGERLDELPDPSLEHAKTHAEGAAALLAEIRALQEQGGLEFDQRLDLDLAELYLQSERHNLGYRFNGLTTLEQMPSAGSDIGSGIFLMFANDDRPAAVRLSNIESRIAKIPDYLEVLLARLVAPIERWTQMDLEKVSGLSSLFSAVERWAAELDWEGKARLHSSVERASKSLADYAARLSKLEANREIFVGEATTRRIIELRGIAVPPEEIFRWAREFLMSTEARIEELAGKLSAKYGLPSSTSADELHTFLNRRFRLQVGGDFTQVIRRYERELARLTEFVQERQLFPLFEDQRIVVLKTPAFMEPSIPAGAMMSPPPFRAGISTSLVYLTLSEALLDEHTDLTIPSMMIHEGIPGHHLQLATAARHPSIVRRHVEAMDQAEGWTTMLEDYMLDVGYCAELSDEVRFMAKRDICRLGARVAIDLYFMTGDRGYLDVGARCDISPTDPFVAAGNLLQAVTGFVPERVRAELNWYSQERGYPLSYLTGNRLVWELKQDVQRHAGSRSGDVDKAFHLTFLEAGNMPMSHLRRHFAHRGLLG